MQTLIMQIYAKILQIFICKKYANSHFNSVLLLQVSYGAFHGSLAELEKLGQLVGPWDWPLFWQR